MNKVKLPKDIVNLLKGCESAGFSPEKIIEVRVKKMFNSTYEKLHTVPLDTLIKALYVGYEEINEPKYKVGDEFNHEDGVVEIIHVIDEMDSDKIFNYTCKVTQVVDIYEYKFFDTYNENELNQLRKLN